MKIFEYRISVDELRSADIEASKTLETLGGLLKRSPPLAVLLAGQQRMLAINERKLAESRTSIACKQGCSYCCYIQVVVSAHEAMQIAEFVNEHCSPQQREEFVKRGRENSNAVRALAQAQRLKLNLACMFLKDGSCGIYNARPMRCRTHHATDVVGCIEMYEQPEEEIPNSYVMAAAVHNDKQVGAIEAAMFLSGFDGNLYELNTALTEALEDPQCRQRWRSKRPAFKRAIVVIEAPDVHNLRR